MEGGVPAVTHPEWRERFPWLVQGTTLACPPSERDRRFDLRLFGTEPSARVLERWESLGRELAVSSVVHARQLHGTNVLLHEPGSPGLHLHSGADGHVTRHADVLLTLSLADCVPLFVVDGPRRILGLAHCGWKGVAAGMVSRVLEVLAHRLAVKADGLAFHLGPAICGDCYEVGPEVFRALGEERSSTGLLDLRERIRKELVEAGAVEENVTVSRHCTRCGELPFFSHRGGSQGRQVAFLAARR